MIILGVRKKATQITETINIFKKKIFLYFNKQNVGAKVHI
jgi:hypothetical protein